jgi:hypothetical protein
MKASLIAFTCVAAWTFLPTAFHSARADDDDAPAGKSVAATTAPAGDAATGDEVIRSAKSFLGLLRDANDDAKAYECMGEEFRKEHTADEFKQAVESLRAGTTLPNVFSVSGDVAMKPKDGGPPRATLRATQSMGSRFAGVPGRVGRMTMLTVSLVQENGKWKVAALHDNVQRDSAINIGKAPRIERRATGTFRVSSAAEGKLVKVGDDSIVLSTDGASGAPATQRTLKIDDQTAVTLAVEIEGGGRGRAVAPATPGNVPSRSLRISRGARSDIKADRHATVELSDDLTRAESVMVIQEADPNAPSEGL